MNQITFKKEANCVFSSLFYNETMQSKISTITMYLVRLKTEIPMYENVFNIKYFMEIS